MPGIDAFKGDNTDFLNKIESLDQADDFLEEDKDAMEAFVESLLSISMEEGSSEEVLKFLEGDPGMALDTGIIGKLNEKFAVILTEFKSYPDRFAHGGMYWGKQKSRDLQFLIALRTLSQNLNKSDSTGGAGKNFEKYGFDGKIGSYTSADIQNSIETSNTVENSYATVERWISQMQVPKGTEKEMANVFLTNDIDKGYFQVISKRGNELEYEYSEETGLINDRKEVIWPITTVIVNGAPIKLDFNDDGSLDFSGSSIEEDMQEKISEAYTKKVLEVRDLVSSWMMEKKATGTIKMEDIELDEGIEPPDVEEVESTLESLIFSMQKTRQYRKFLEVFHSKFPKASIPGTDFYVKGEEDAYVFGLRVQGDKAQNEDLDMEFDLTTILNADGTINDAKAKILIENYLLEKVNEWTTITDINDLMPNWFNSSFDGSDRVLSVGKEDLTKDSLFEKAAENPKHPLEKIEKYGDANLYDMRVGDVVGKLSTYHYGPFISTVITIDGSKYLSGFSKRSGVELRFNLETGEYETLDKLSDETNKQFLKEFETYANTKVDDTKARGKLNFDILEGRPDFSNKAPKNIRDMSLGDLYVNSYGLDLQNPFTEIYKNKSDIDKITALNPPNYILIGYVLFDCMEYNHNEFDSIKYLFDGLIDYTNKFKIGFDFDKFSDVYKDLHLGGQSPIDDLVDEANFFDQNNAKLLDPVMVVIAKSSVDAKEKLDGLYKEDPDKFFHYKGLVAELKPRASSKSDKNNDKSNKYFSSDISDYFPK